MGRDRTSKGTKIRRDRVDAEGKGGIQGKG
jgi:hypothetical protein